MGTIAKGLHTLKNKRWRWSIYSDSSGVYKEWEGQIYWKSKSVPGPKVIFSGIFDLCLQPLFLLSSDFRTVWPHEWMKSWPNCSGIPWCYINNRWRDIQNGGLAMERKRLLQEHEAWIVRRNLKCIIWLNMLPYWVEKINLRSNQEKNTQQQQQTKALLRLDRNSYKKYITTSR